MSLIDKLILGHLRRTHISQNYLMTESIEVIQQDKLYKINDTARISFENVIEDVWKFALITTENTRELGRVYKVSENDYVARSNTAPNIEKSGKSMVDAALELCAFLGEI
jgi:hypothetical protein